MENSSQPYKLETFYKTKEGKNLGLSSTGMVVNSLKEGVWLDYYITGDIYSETIFLKGERHGSSKIYYSSGKIWETGFYEEGFRDGLWNIYRKSGEIETQISYKRGLFHGPYKEFHKNGNLKYFVNILNGEVSGIETRYSISNKIMYETLYID